jgi:leader peptidase (prepilin peptidase)/N-methyltransferase
MEGLNDLAILWWAVIGLVVGSFLNVAIHRLPLEGQSVGHPRRSRCPSCGHELTWRENIPLLSWSLQLGRCRACGWRIPWRSPLVEALTAVLWAWVAWRAADPTAPLVLIQNLVLAGLIVATFVDFACFEIPDEVSIGGIVLAPVASLVVPELHAATRVALELSEGEVVRRGPALVASLAGILVGGGILLAVGRLGRRLYGRDAMGLGDVKLLAAGGGFVGPGGALVALLLASLAGSVVGLLNLLRYLVVLRARASRRGSVRSWARSIRAARVAGRYIPFGPYLALGIGIALLDWNHVETLLARLLSAP